MADFEKSGKDVVVRSKFPKAAWFILPSVLFEQCCFFGIRSMLNQYLKSGLGLTPHEAKGQVHLFIGMTNLFPLIGAVLSDSFLGKFKTILIASIVYLVGTIFLSVSSINDLIAEFGNYPTWTFILPSLMVAIGSGSIMPNISSLGGDSFEGHESSLLDKFYSMFYLVVSTGILLGQYIAPYLKEYVQCYGTECYFLAFGFSAIVYGLSFLSFLLGTKFYKNVPPVGEFLPFKSLKVVFFAAKGYYNASPGQRIANGSWLNFSNQKFGVNFVEETRLLGRLIVMLLPLTFMWMLFDQSGTEWQNQYELMDKNLFGLFFVPTEASSSIRYLIVIILIPILSYIIYPSLERRGIYISETSRIIFGFSSILLSFIVSVILYHVLEAHPGDVVYAGELVVECNGCINSGWQIPQLFLMAVGDAILSPVVIQFSYTQVGPMMKSSASSLWLLTVALGNYLILAVEAAMPENIAHTTPMWIYVGLSSFGLLIFILLSKFWFVPRIESLPSKL